MERHAYSNGKVELDRILSIDSNSSYKRMNKGLSSFGKQLEKSGFGYYNIENRDNDMYVTFGKHDSAPDTYYTVVLKDVSNEKKKIGISDAYVLKSKDKESLTQILDTGSKLKSDVDFSGYSIKPKRINTLLKEVYDSSSVNSNMPEIKEPYIDKKILYASAALYGGLAIGVFNHLTDNFVPGYETLLMGMDIAPFLALYGMRKIKSLATVGALGLTAWIANSIMYYPVGLALGHGTLNGMVDWYRTQIGLGKGSYVDHFGNGINVTVDSKTKAMSYVARGAAATVLGLFEPVTSRISKKLSKKEA